MKGQHPRFLGFLWPHHKFERRKDLPCTKKCVHCSKEKHSPRKTDMKVIEKNKREAGLWDRVIHIECHCLICGTVWHRFLVDPLYY